MRGRHDKRSEPERFFAFVDFNGPNGCWLWTGATAGKGYARFSFNKTAGYAHRWAYEHFVGPIPAGMLIDHRPTCPKRCVNPLHLRLATNKQNGENRARAISKSGVRGVYWHKHAGRWVAQVRHNKRTITVGLFDTVEEAGAAALAKRIELFTHNDLDRGAS